MTGKKETNDSDLFRAVMQDVKPLKRRMLRSAASPGSAEKETAPIPASGKKRQVRRAVAVAPPPLPPKPKRSALQHGDIGSGPAYRSAVQTGSATGRSAA